MRTAHLVCGDHVWQAWYDPGTPRFVPSDAARRFLGRAGEVLVLSWFAADRRPLELDATHAV